MPCEKPTIPHDCPSLCGVTFFENLVNRCRLAVVRVGIASWGNYAPIADKHYLLVRDEVHTLAVEGGAESGAATCRMDSHTIARNQKSPCETGYFAGLYDRVRRVADGTSTP